MEPVQISILVNTLIFGIACIGSGVLIWIIKLPGKGYKLLFLLYTIFWIPLMLLRENTATMQSGIGEMSILWIPLSAYGFVGIFVRPLANIISARVKSRKSFIYLALFIQIATYIPIIACPCSATNIIQSIGVGVGASCIATYQLLFDEQYSKSKTFLTISVLSIPPLLADFISSPITSMFRSNNTTDPNILKYLWLIGLAFVLISWVIAFFVKEDRNLVNLYDSKKLQIKTKSEITTYVLLVFLGFLIAFIKFANSSSLAVLHIQKLSDNTSGPYEGYLSLLFSFGQLIGGLLTGLVLIKYTNRLLTFGIGSIVWVLYHVLAMIITNPFDYLGVHILNGLAYGIVYNFILGFILMRQFKKRTFNPMDIYQSILSVGITVSTFFVSYLKGNLKDLDLDQYMKLMQIINGVIIGTVGLSFFTYLSVHLIERNIKMNNQQVSQKRV